MAEAPLTKTPVETPEDPRAASIGLILNAWLYGKIVGGPIGRQTDCWNALQDAIPALKAALLKGD